VVLITGPIPFLWNTFYYISAVRGRSERDFSILGRYAVVFMTRKVWKKSFRRAERAQSVTFAPIRNFRHGEGILIGCFHVVFTLFFFCRQFFQARAIGYHNADSEFYDICPTDSGYPKDMGFTTHWESPRITGIQVQRGSTKNLDKNTQSFELAFPES